MKSTHSNPTIARFIEHFSPCRQGQEFASQFNIPEEIWSRAEPTYLVWIATRRGVLTDKELRLFAVWSARQVQFLMKNPHSLAALDVAERFSNGQATFEELKAARQKAYASYAADASYTADAASYAAAASSYAAAASSYAAATAAASYASYAADAAAYASSSYAAAAASSYAASSSYSAADAAAADADARKNQAQWLRANTQPNFERALQPL